MKLKLVDISHRGSKDVVIENPIYFPKVDDYIQWDAYSQLRVEKIIVDYNEKIVEAWCL